MKYYVLLTALVLGLFAGIVPVFGQIIPGDNVTFLAFDNEGNIGLEDGTVLDMSDDGNWLLIFLPPEYLTVISKWFIYSDETISNRLLTNMLKSGETYEPTSRGYEANVEEYKFREPVSPQTAPYKWPVREPVSPYKWPVREGVSPPSNI